MTRTPLKYILESDTARNDIQGDLDGEYDPIGNFSPIPPALSARSFLAKSLIHHTRFSAVSR